MLDRTAFPTIQNFSPSRFVQIHFDSFNWSLRYLGALLKSIAQLESVSSHPV